MSETWSEPLPSRRLAISARSAERSRSSRQSGQRVSDRRCAIDCDPAHAPERIILGEVRGKEAMNFFVAINTDHGSSMTTLHAETTPLAVQYLAVARVIEEGITVLRCAVLRREDINPGDPNHLVAALLADSGILPEGGFHAARTLRMPSNLGSVSLSLSISECSARRITLSCAVMVSFARLLSSQGSAAKS